MRLRKSVAIVATLLVSFSTPPALSISRNRAFICRSIPTAGVHGVCPRSPFFKASFKLKYIHFIGCSSTRSCARFDRTISDMPGGQANAFCDPAITTSTPKSAISKSSAKKELIASTTKSILLRRQKSLINFLS